MPINLGFQNYKENQENTTDLAVQLCLNSSTYRWYRARTGHCTATAAAGFAPTAWVGAIAAE